MENKIDIEDLIYQIESKLRKEMKEEIKEIEIKLRQEILELEKKIQSQNNNNNIDIDYLNNTYIPDIYFDDWIKINYITTTDITLLMEDKNIFNVIKQLLESSTTHWKNNPPILAYKNKKTNLYYYSNSTEKWLKITHEKFALLLKYMNKYFIQASSIWYEENIKRIANNDKLDNLYNETLTNIMKMQFEENSTFYSKIKSIIMNQLIVYS
jgi:hypothetical protein